MTQSELLRELAQYTHFNVSDLMNRANRLREAGTLKGGGKGSAAPNIEANAAALLVLAAMSGASANTCADALRKMPEGLSDAITKILDDPTMADKVKAFSFDYVNNFAVITYNDEVKTFGKQDDFNSGVSVFLHGRVFRVLACAMLPEDKQRSGPAYKKWLIRLLAIGKEQGDEAALKWMEENPFKADKTAGGNGE
jgi:hypothetical protein